MEHCRYIQILCCSYALMLYRDMIPKTRRSYVTTYSGRINGMCRWYIGTPIFEASVTWVCHVKNTNLFHSPL